MPTLIAATDDEVRAYIALREAVCELEELRKMAPEQKAGSAGEVVLYDRILAVSRRVVELAKSVAMFESIAFAGGVLGAREWSRHASTSDHSEESLEKVDA